jgi:aryl-alcohol dehydrogenase-like predicted oxidoreductase
MPELALRFILGNDDVSTIIPGMRKLSHVQSNTATSNAGPLPPELQEKMRGFRWVRKPAPWSQ